MSSRRLRHRWRRPGRKRSSPNRWKIQRRNPWPHGRPCLSRSRSGRPHSRHPRRRQNHHRHKNSQIGSGNLRRRNQPTHVRMETSAAPLQDRSLREIRRLGKVRCGRRYHVPLQLSRLRQKITPASRQALPYPLPHSRWASRWEYEVMIPPSCTRVSRFQACPEVWEQPKLTALAPDALDAIDQDSESKVCHPDGASRSCHLPTRRRPQRKPCSARYL